MEAKLKVLKLLIIAYVIALQRFMKVKIAKQKQPVIVQILHAKI